jgi:hypothetical protein
MIEALQLLIRARDGYSLRRFRADAMRFSAIRGLRRRKTVDLTI